MDEYIDRDEAIRTALDMYEKVIGHGISQVDAMDIVSGIENIPTADVQEVVRCKDCKRAQQMMFVDYYICKRHNKCRKATDFCSYGQRRDT